MFSTGILAITPWPAVSALVWFVLLVAVLYLARRTAHQAIQTASGALSRGLRLAAHSVAHAELRLAERNREVLLAAGREAKEHIVEREFARVGETVRKDLTSYPALHRALSESITRIEEDHQKAVEVPPEAAGLGPGGGSGCQARRAQTVRPTSWATFTSRWSRRTTKRCRCTARPAASAMRCCAR